MTAAEYEVAVGAPPELDDLERANCALAGTGGHLYCGVCPCGLPRFQCPDSRGKHAVAS